MSKALTVRAIEAFKGAGKRREIPDAALTGLFLVVQPSGAKSWAVRYRTAGRTRKLTLGRVSHPGPRRRTQPWPGRAQRRRNGHGPGD